MVRNLDVQVKTALGKDETLSTVQLDFLLPERFDLTYVGEDGKQHRPVVIHRGVVSTMERFVAFLIEEYKGAFPTWLAPVQAQVIPVSPDVHFDYAKEVQEKLKAAGIRVELDTRMKKSAIKSVKHKFKKYLICSYLVIKKWKKVVKCTEIRRTKIRNSFHSKNSVETIKKEAKIV